jgi:hypothetical protein
MTQSITRPRGKTRPTRISCGRPAGLIAVAFLALTPLAAGCGGSGGSPSAGVAHISATTASTAGASPASAGASAPAENPLTRFRAYASCMRSHGVASFPEPKPVSSGEVAIQIRPGSGLDPNSATFRSAQQACQSLLPEGGPRGAGPSVSPSEQARYLKAAACIRAHGLPNFPDPTFSNGVHIPNLDAIERSPAFPQAEQACRSLIPMGEHHGGGEPATPGHAGGR